MGFTHPTTLHRAARKRSIAAYRDQLKFPQDYTANTYAVEQAHARDPLAPFLRNAPWPKGSAGGLGFQPENQSTGTSTGEEMTGKMRKMPIPRLVANGKPKKVALTAAMRKLLVTLNEMVGRGQMWDADYIKPRQDSEENTSSNKKETLKVQAS